MDKKEIKREYKFSISQIKKQFKCDKKLVKSQFKANKRLLKDKKHDDIKELKNKFIYLNEKLPSEQIANGFLINPECEVPEIKVKKPSKRYLKPAPVRPLLEEIGNAVTHGIGAILSIVAFCFMMMHSDTTSEYVAAGVYCFGLFIMFTMSCLYHSFKGGSSVKNVFRHFDYMCIYLLIGATFAPILLCFIGGVFGLVFFILQWLIIATGITLIGVFGPARLKYIHFPLYFVIGWSGLIFIPQMIGTCLPLFWWILGGGVLYSVGMIPFALKKNVAHFIWHFFVLFGAVAQWIGIYQYIYLA